MKIWQLLFKTDEKVDSIHEDTARILGEAADEAKQLRDLLRKNGVTMQIYIATGGDRRSR